MKITYLKNNNAIELVLLLLCPLLALPVIIFGISKGKLNNLVLLSAIMALFAFIFPPFADLYRHTQQYLHFQTYGNTGVVFYGGNFDFIFYSLSNYLAKNNIPFEYIRALFVFISYQISFFLYKKCLIVQSIDPNSKESFYLFWVFFLSVPFIWIVNGLRMATACYLAVYGWILTYNNKIIGYFIFVLSLFLHFGALLFAPIFMLKLFPTINLSNRMFFITSIFILIAGSFLLFLLPQSLVQKMNMDGNVEYYMKNSKKAFDSVMSVNGLIAMYLERAMIIYIYMRTLLVKSISGNNRDDFIIKICLLFWLIFHPFTILFQKFSLFIIPIILYLVLKRSTDIRTLKNILICCLISFGAYFYGYRKPILKMPITEMLTTPVYVLMNADTKSSLYQYGINK